MKKKIFHNWGLKLASLFLAFVLWFLIAKIGDPPDTATFYNIPVRLINTELLENENKVYEILDNTDSVRVTIRAPRSVTSELRGTDVTAEADMAKLTDINTIEITYTIQNAKVESVSGDHDVVRLNVEERATKWIRVQYNTIGDVAEGYLVTGASLDQNRIEVTGPKSAVDRISYAGIDVDVTGAATNVSLNVEPLFYDNEGNLLELTSVKKNVSYIHVDVEVLATKEVPIELNVMGIPAEGYLATGVMDCSVDTVRIAGRASTLAAISKISIPAEQINITGQSGDLVNILNLKDYLPDGARLADSSFNGRVTVTVYIEAAMEKTLVLPSDNYVIQNIPDGYTFEMIEPEGGHELVISGLRSVVNGLNRENVTGTLDIAAWMAEEGMESVRSGLYTIPADYNLPEGIIIKQEPEVKVTISEMED